jgi:hypothetical protein
MFNESETSAENLREADARAQRARKAEAGQLGESAESSPGNESQPNS